MLGAAVVGEVGVVGGTVLSNAYRPGARPLDALAYALLALSGACAALGLVWPSAALLLALAATSTFYSLGYVSSSPLFLAVLAVLFVGATPHRTRRSICIGLLALAAVIAQHLGTAGLAGLNTGMAATTGWIAAAVLAGHAFAAQRDYVAGMRERAYRAEQTRELETRRRVTEERLRIARELHDVVSHTISVINVQAGVAAHVIQQRPEQATLALETIRDASKEALRELGGILAVLRQESDEAATAPAPGLADLEGLLSVTRQAGLPVDFTVSGQARRLPPTVEVAAYRIVQESLTNALRYARGGCATVTLRYDQDGLVLEVSNSPGSSLEPVAGGGRGIIGMRERAAAVGGTLETDPRPEGGFCVHASLPAHL